MPTRCLTREELEELETIATGFKCTVFLRVDIILEFKRHVYAFTVCDVNSGRYKLRMTNRVTGDVCYLSIDEDDVFHFDGYETTLRPYDHAKDSLLQLREYMCT